jgi:hypothetical protein
VVHAADSHVNTLPSDESMQSPLMIRLEVICNSLLSEIRQCVTAMVAMVAMVAMLAIHAIIARFKKMRGVSQSFYSEEREPEAGSHAALARQAPQRT